MLIECGIIHGNGSHGFSLVGIEGLVEDIHRFDSDRL
jgi:hypothetical protein